ncbi:MAG TPA: PBP1A family penicillin-binding protein [Vicinamibacterales bacterium]|jgi:penicillin-binding protein 1A
MTRAVRDRIAAGVFAVLVIASVVSVTWLLRQAYAVHRLTRGVGDTWFLAADGQRWFRMDEHRRDVPLDQIPAHLQHAFIAIEDHRFYSHPGIDPIALGRAAFRNLRSPGTVEGGSTLTQQLARTLFLSNKKTYGRKIREAAIAMMIDGQLTKDQVLELYLNRIYLSAGVYGVETMSRHLFGRPVEQLNLAECALIAGLARAPATLSPWSNLDGALARSRVVLTRMREEGFITESQEREAIRTSIRVRPFPGAADPRGGYAKEFLRQLFRERFGGDHPPDWEVRTTFVPALQDAAEQSVRAGLARFNQPDLQAALVAIDPRNGNILAIVGGRDFAESQFNRAARSRRQPGSAFKPFLYAAALEHGYSPVSTIQGLTTIQPQGPDEWSPRNADGSTPDVLTLRAALLESNNRAATVLQQQVGSRPVLRLASHVGLRDMPDVPSLSLGTGLVTPLELTAAYATFPNGGLAVVPRGIVRVFDADGGIALDNPVESERVISVQSAFQMVSMLGDVIDRGTGSSVRRAGIGFPVGGKTGTTNEFKDAWFVGFSSNLVVGVWVGFDQPKPIGRDAYGSRYAAPIWTDFMRRSTRTRIPGAFDPPVSLQEVTLCRVSYLRPVEGCPTYTEYLKSDDQAPGRLCPVHEGSMKQQVRRAVEGILSNLGRRIRGIFR